MFSSFFLGCSMARTPLVMLSLFPAQGQLIRQSLQDVDSAAVCTDGSPASYYFQAAASDVPAFSCDACTTQGFGPDECGCGYCGSYGGCDYTCGEDESQPPPGPKCAKSPFSCDECTAQGYGPDECGCGYCSSYGGCDYTCGKDESQPPEGPKCTQSLFTCDECTTQGYGPDECGCGYCGSYGGCGYTCGKDESQPPEGPKCIQSSDVGPISNSSFSTAPQSAPQSVNIWIVFLEGGGWCYDQESCEKRCGSPTSPNTGALCSSKNYPSSMGPSGLFYPLNDDLLANANKAYVKYCTSDAHMGNANNFGFQFRGGVVVQAVLRDLVSTHGLGGGAGRDLLIFGGGSAGGRGGMIHLDYVPEMLGSAAANVDVVGFLDSPAWVDIAPFSTYFPGFPYITKQVHSYANVAHLGNTCSQAHPTELWKCMYGQYRLPTLVTPYFLVASQADGWQLYNNVGRKPSSSEELSYAQTFAGLTRDLLESVKARSSENAVYSWQCYNHYVSTSHNGFDGFSCASSTMGQALQQFLGWAPQTTSPALSWIDSCTGFACGSGCSSVSLANSSRNDSEFHALVV